jgi:tRNA(Ile)-lysidine synthase
VPAAAPEATDFSVLKGVAHAALAVSGGSDSLALMRLAGDWAARHHPVLKLSVLTVDHRLRRESTAEARQVGRWAAAFGLSHHILAWADEPKPGTGLQAAARAARYGLMAAWCRANGADLLLTGHTLDDQAETVAMRLGRTSSPDSLSGIRPLGDWQGLPIGRPLLDLRRQALRCYLEGIGQPWIDDPSNEDTRFERVRVRRALAAAEQAGTAPDWLAGLAAANAVEAAGMAQDAEAWLGRWLEEHPAGFCVVPATAFRELPENLQQRVLGRITSHYGGEGPRPEPEELRRLARWACGGDGASRRTLGGAVFGRRKPGFWVTREPGRITVSPGIVPETGKLLWDKRFLIEAAPGSAILPSRARRPDLGTGVPVFAREAYPSVEARAATQVPPRVTFCSLVRR